MADHEMAAAVESTTAAAVAPAFSAAEAAVYDRQMRLWGVEAQQRLQSSHVLVSGLSALASELVKNLVLAGVSVTVHDTAVVTEDTVATQFFFDQEDIGKNRADAVLDKVRDLNPLVKVHSETTPLEQTPDDWFTRFSVVCLVGASPATELRVNTFCHTHHIAFYAAHAFGFDGIVFADLGCHTFRRAPFTSDSSSSTTTAAAAPAVIPETIEFPSLETAQQVAWSSLLSKRKRGPQIPRVYIKHQLLHDFRRERGEMAIQTGVDEFVGFAMARLEAQGLPRDFFSESDLRSLAEVAHVDLVPVGAILAGILGQEVIKAVSQKDEPICNYFCFDGAAGVVRRIG